MIDVQQQMSDLDTEIADLVHTQSNVGHDGRVALQVCIYYYPKKYNSSGERLKFGDIDLG